MFLAKKFQLLLLSSLPLFGMQQPLPPQPDMPVAVHEKSDTKSRLAAATAWLTTRWQQAVPQPARDVMGIALDLAIITAIKHSPELLARTLNRWYHTKQSQTFDVDFATGCRQTENFMWYYGIPCSFFNIHPRYVWLGALACCNAYQLRHVKIGRLAAANASILCGLVANPVQEDLNERLERLVQPLVGNDQTAQFLATTALDMATTTAAEWLFGRVTRR